MGHTWSPIEIKSMWFERSNYVCPRIEAGFSLTSYGQFCIKDKSTISVILVRIIVCKSPSLLTSGRIYLVVCTYSFWCILGYVWLCYYGKEDDSDVWMLLRKISVCRNSKIWKATTLCVLWTVWIERSSRIFWSVERFNHVIEQLTLRSLYDWMGVLGSL